MFGRVHLSLPERPLIVSGASDRKVYRDVDWRDEEIPRSDRRPKLFYPKAVRFGSVRVVALGPSWRQFGCQGLSRRALIGRDNCLRSGARWAHKRKRRVAAL